MRYPRLSYHRHSALIRQVLFSAAAAVSFTGTAIAADASAPTEQPPIVVSPARPPIPTPYGDLAAKMQAARQVSPLPPLQPVPVPTPLPSPAPGASLGVIPSADASKPPAQPATPPAPTAQAALQGQSVGSVPGVTDAEVRFGLSAPISGPQRDLGHQIRQGIEAAFDAQNDAGGVEGRKLALVVRDDGYEPARAADAARELREQDHVFATIGDVGTATATAALPYALDAHMPKLFAFTGADVLRAVPPDRIVFNLRASYGEETAATVRYLITVRGLKPSEIAVFAQDDAFGRSGVEGVKRTMRTLSGGYTEPLAVVTYARNSMDVSNAVAQLRTSRKGRLRAVVMVAAYKAAARFVEEMKPLFPGLIYTDVSFAGSTQLAEELTSLGRGLVDGVVVTQVVPNPSGHSKEVDAYRAAMARYFPGEAVDYVSLEGWLDARLLIEGLGRAGRNLTPENLSDALESIKGYDLGMGEPIVMSSMDHQASHHVWGTVLDKDGHYQPLDLR